LTLPKQGGFLPLGFPLGSWAFAIRIWIAAIVALYLSFWLQLEAPSTALVTVAIVAEPTRGQALEKAVFRVIATIIGVAASIIITGLFAQTRDFLLVACAGWLGLTVYVSGLLDGNRAYAAVLSGYTVALLSIRQIDDPGHVFESGMARGAAIIIGIVSIMIVNDLLSAPERHTTLAAQLADIHRRIGDYVKTAILGETTNPTAPAALLAEIAAHRPEIASSAFESHSGPDKLAAGHNAAVALVAELHAARSLNVLPVVADRATSERIVHALAREEGELTLPTIVWPRGTQSDASPTATLAWTFKELLRRDEQVRQNLVALRTDRRPPCHWRALIYRSNRVAVEGGIRAAIWLALAGMVFVYAGWPAASSALSLVSITIGLGALTPNSRVATALALIAAPIAGIMAGVVEFVILDGADDFPLLAIGLAPLVIGAALLIASPNRKLSALGRTSLIFAVTTFLPSNPQIYDAQSYIFSFLFNCAAPGLLLAMQFLVPPVSEDRRRRWFLLSARQESAQVPSADRRFEPEEEMFRDAGRIGQILVAGGTAPNNVQEVEEALSHFDQSSTIRLCDDKLNMLANGPLAELAEEVRVALRKRELRSLRNASQALRNVSPSDSLVSDLCPALMLASYQIEAVAGRAHLDEVTS
jgi:uncharacterized membrane protein YccC